MWLKYVSIWISILGDLSNNFTKESNFVENIVEDQGENMQT